jgi:hypothetical protein
MRGRPTSDPLYWTIRRKKSNKKWPVLFIVILCCYFICNLDVFQLVSHRVQSQFSISKLLVIRWLCWGNRIWVSYWVSYNVSARKFVSVMTLQGIVGWSRENCKCSETEKKTWASSFAFVCVT